MKRILFLIFVCLVFVCGCDDGNSSLDVSGDANNSGSSNDLLKNQWVTISAGNSHTCGIKGDNTLWCWGNNGFGQLGIGTSGMEDCDAEDRWCKDTDKPVQTGTDTDWNMISSGGSHTCALKVNGTLWCWGRNGESGVLGIGTTSDDCGDYTCADKKEPTQVGDATDWSYVSSTDDYTCALKTNGTLWCWGSNNNHQFGIYDMYLKNPTQIGADVNWSIIKTGYSALCALRNDQTFWCSSAPCYNSDKNTDPWLSFEMDNNGVIGRKNDGTIWECGYSSNGKSALIQIGTDNDWISVEGTSSFDSREENGTSCGVKRDGSLWCWGENDYGQLGIGTSNFQSCSIVNGGLEHCEDRAEPTQVGNETNWAYVSMGDYHTCAIKTDGTLWCWGRNILTPTQVVEGK